MVTEVDERGNGYKHGLRAGDQILDINGVNLEQLGASERYEQSDVLVLSFAYSVGIAWNIVS